MSYEFYLDVFFTENFVMSYLLLRMTNRLLHCSATHVRSLLCAGSFTAIQTAGFLWTCRLGMISTLLVSVAATTFMVRFGCKMKRKKILIQGMLLFYMGAACMGMLFSVLGRMTGKEGIWNFLFVSGSGYVLFNVGVLIYDRGKEWQQRTCQVTICQNGTCKVVKGLYDTGNMLWDATLQSYVSVMNLALVKDLFPEPTQKSLEAFCAGKPPEREEDIRSLRPHFIPYRCVGEKGGFLPVIVLDYMFLEQGNLQKVISHPVIAIDRTGSSSLQSYQMILNPNLIDN